MFWHTLLALILFVTLPLATAASLTEGSKPTQLLIYDNGLTVVHVYKSLRLDSNDTQINYEGVPPNALADSIYLELPKSVQLISQHFSTTKIPELYERKDHNGNILFSPHHMREQQTKLTLEVAAKESVQTQLRLEYLMQGIALELRYRVVFDGIMATLEGFANIDNQSEQTFTNTKLSLLLGEVQRVDNTAPIALQHRSFESIAATPAADEGYTLHTITQRVSLPKKTQTQLPFMKKIELKAKKEFHTTLTHPLYLHGEQKSPITQSLLIKNLPQSLAKGVVRTFADADGKRLLLGESSIPQTLRGDSLELRLGLANDLGVTQRVLHEEQTKTRRSKEIGYELHNMSNTDKSIELRIPFVNSQNAKITTTKPYRFTKGNLVTFTLLVAARTKTSFNVIFESEK